MTSTAETDADLQSGTVTDWDDPAGYGTITGHDGQKYFLHCTAIADATRTIEPQCKVSFQAIPGPMGQWQAANVIER